MRRGFTLLELLIVIVIIGVIAVMVGPTFTSGSDVARVKTASRGVMQLSRYARTMALLHQTPVDLVFTSDGGVSVAQVGSSGESVVSAKAFSVTNSAAEASEAEAADVPAAAEQGTGQGGGSAYVMADLAIEKKYEQIQLFFEGYTDTLDEGRHSLRSSSLSETESESSSDQERQTFRVRYKSNGTCRPYRVRVAAEGDENCAMTVVVDLLGSARIETEDE